MDVATSIEQQLYNDSLDAQQAYGEGIRKMVRALRYLTFFRPGQTEDERRAIVRQVLEAEQGRREVL